ncbi:hypothetical protein C7T94_14395 [Pedobacter yulinensis]|uniref:Uncharacterized protein n=2 Tax=Pedobacter yulinensis TaxID=2126353 RepID=A0A2T3HMW1_9SPHI|nr:hypothetical protein C7T94_14395 [Pedobacter yulinensis]
MIGGKATYREDLRINQIESICEFVLEFAFDVDVPENQDSDDGPAGKILLACLQPAPFAYAVEAEHRIITHRSHYNPYIPTHIEKRESPPPEQAVSGVQLHTVNAG